MLEPRLAGRAEDVNLEGTLESGAVMPFIHVLIIPLFHEREMTPRVN